MGVSTDAILCWGIDLGEETPWADKAEELGFDTDDLEDFFAFVFCGVEKPKEAWVADGENESYSAYWKAKREALKAYGVELVTHCSYDYPMHILAISASETRANRGDPQTITSLDVNPEWSPKLKEACEKLGIDPEDGQWVLCSLWG